MENKQVFLQIGATRDGLESYLAAAHRRRMCAVLVETPEYIQCRRILGRQEFDLTLAVANSSDPQSVCEALSAHGIQPTLLLAGFEQYNECAFAVAERLKVLPYNSDATAVNQFYPMNKAQQRTLISRSAPWIAQPWHRTFALQEEIDVSQLKTRLPLVIKPVNSGGGWGVCLLRTEAEIKESLKSLREMSNFDGSKFVKVLVEQYVEGTECSVQGVCHNGNMQILTYCEKLIKQEPLSPETNLLGFREAGHFATNGENTPDIIKSFAFDCLKAVGYQNGAFHIDLIKAAEEPVFIEMGFRMSGGGLVEIVRRISGLDWGEEVFAAFLNYAVKRPPNVNNYVCLAQIVATKPAEIEAAYALCENGFDIEIQMRSQTMPFDTLSVERYPTLQADFSRHIGKLGFIRIAAQDMRQLRDLAAQIFVCAAAVELEKPRQPLKIKQI